MSAPLEQQLRSIYRHVDRLQTPVAIDSVGPAPSGERPRREPGADSGELDSTATSTIHHRANGHDAITDWDIIMLEATDYEVSTSQNGPKSRWLLVAAVIAALAVAGGLILAATGSDDDGVPADQPEPTPTLTDTAMFEAENVVEQFVGALNGRDLGAIEALSTDGLTVADSGAVNGALPLEELPSLMAWYDAFDWRWEDAACEASAVGVDVECELFEQNRLTDLTGAERPATASFAMADGQIESVTVVADLSEYDPKAFSPFLQWVQTNHPDDVTRMWTGGGRPVLTAESAALFDQHLSEYTNTAMFEAATGE